MPSDLQVVEVQSLLLVSRIEIVPGVTPLTVQVEGGPFAGVDEVRVNDVPSPSYIVRSENLIWAQVPDGVADGTLVVSVLSANSLITDRVLLRFRLGRQTRKVSGLPRLVQQFMRLLMMTPGTNLAYPSLGGGLLQVARSAYAPGGSKDLRADAFMAVQRTTEQLIALQARDNRSPREEKLMRASVERCGIQPQLQSLLLDIEMLSQTGKRYLVGTQL